MLKGKYEYGSMTVQEEVVSTAEMLQLMYMYSVLTWVFLCAAGLTLQHVRNSDTVYTNVPFGDNA